MNFRQKMNTRTGQFNLVPSDAIVTFKPVVANAAALPPTGNTVNDGRITADTGHLYIWSGSAWVDQGDILDVDWAALTNKPSSSVADIDSAVSLKHSNSLDHAASGQFNQATAAEISGLNAKALPVDNDVTLIEDSETTPTAFGKKKLTWAVIKSTLKTYFDGIYTLANLGGTTLVAVKADTDVASAISLKHSHTNKSLLDSLTYDEDYKTMTITTYS